MPRGQEGSDVVEQTVADFTHRPSTQRTGAVDGHEGRGGQAFAIRHSPVQHLISGMSHSIEGQSSNRCTHDPSKH